MQVAFNGFSEGKSNVHPQLHSQPITESPLSFNQGKAGAAEKENIPAENPAENEMAQKQQHAIGKPLRGTDSAFYIHIPKCAGASFHRDILPLFSNLNSPGRKNDEQCFGKVLRQMPNTKIWLTMLRSPRQHVISQHLHCKWSPLGRRLTSGTNFPRTGSFEGDLEQWVHHFEKPEVRDDFGCFNPWNMQTRFLTCDAADVNCDAPAGGEGCVDVSLAYHNYGAQPTLEVAEGFYDKISFAGIVELYNVSRCVLKYKVQQTIDPSCECGGPPAPTIRRSGFDPRHGVPAYDSATVSATTLKVIDAMSHLDQELYRRAVDRFLSEVRDIEDATKKKLLCDADLEKFRKKTSYLYVDRSTGLSPAPKTLLAATSGTGGAIDSNADEAAFEVVEGILDVPISGLPPGGDET